MAKYVKEMAAAVCDVDEAEIAGSKPVGRAIDAAPALEVGAAFEAR
jgi:hypothetical protein